MFDDIISSKEDLYPEVCPEKKELTLLSILELASTFGYLVITRPSVPEAHQLIDELNEHYIVINKWNLNPNSQIQDYWDKFPEQKCCLRCENKKSNTDPFCGVCLILINNDGYEEKIIKNPTDPERKKQLIEKLEELKGYSGSWDTGFPCKKCKRVFINKDEYKQFWSLGVKEVHCYTSSKYPSIYDDHSINSYYCIICIDELCREKGLITSPKFSYPKASLPDLSSPEYMSTNDIAVELGFLEKEKQKIHEAKFHTIAYRHVELSLIYRWNRTPRRPNTQRLMNVFLSRKSCIRCKKKNHTISKQNPFCPSCTNHIQYQKQDLVTERTPKELSARLDRCVFSIGFTTVTGSWTNSWICSVCKRDSSTIHKDRFAEFREGYSSSIPAYSVRTGNCGTYCLMCLDECFRKGNIY